MTDVAGNKKKNFVNHKKNVNLSDLFSHFFMFHQSYALNAGLNFHLTLSFCYAVSVIFEAKTKIIFDLHSISLLGKVKFLLCLFLLFLKQKRKIIFDLHSISLLGKVYSTSISVPIKPNLYHSDNSVSLEQLVVERASKTEVQTAGWANWAIVVTTAIG